MAKRTTPSDNVSLDPIFSIPVGAEDVFAHNREPDDVSVVTDEDNSLAAADEGSFDDGSFSYDQTESDYVDDGQVDDDDITLSTPTAFSIVAPQVMRRAPGGLQVVDIVLEVEAIDGATNYEVQVVKI